MNSRSKILSLSAKMLRYLTPVKNLPDPSQETTPEKRALIDSVNKYLSKSTGAAKRKRGEYNSYSPEIRCEIGQSALENGVMKTARKFSTKLDVMVSESTVRNIRRSYLRERSKTLQQKLKLLPKGDQGRPVLLGKYDSMVSDYVKKMRDAGGVINSQIAMGIAKGIVIHHDKTLLSDNGGWIEINKSWAQSFLRRIGFTKRKGTKNVKTLPSDFGLSVCSLT